MVLPPGREAVSVPGFDATVNPKLTQAAGEVAAWVDYLLHPQDHDGPRVYRDRFGEGDSPFPRRNEDLDSRSSEYETVSIFADFADDPEQFLRPVQAIAGLRQELLSNSYDKLLQGYFTLSDKERGPGPEAIADDAVVHYAEVNSARMDWGQMRTGWEGDGRPEANMAYLYEEAFIKYQVVTENCLYAVAEHLTRYWVIFDKAGQDLLELMDAFTKECSVYEPTSSGGLVLDFASIVVDVLIGAVVTVVTGGVGTTVRQLLKQAGSTTLNKVLTQATKEGPKKKQVTLDKHYDLRDTARQYLERIEAIEREVDTAVTGMVDSLRKTLDEKRGRRTYKSDKGDSTEEVPNVLDFKKTTR